MRYLIPALFCIIAGIGQAEIPMTEEEFDAYVTGKIIVYGAEGTPEYGVEHYMQNRRVLWSAFDGQCLEGIWYYEAPNICFAYEGFTDPHCWAVFATENGIAARHTVTDQLIFEGREDPSALICADMFS